MLSKELFQPTQLLKEAFSPLFAEAFLNPQKDHLFPSKSEGFWPNVNVVETDKDYQIQVELPGMTEKDFEVSMEDGILEISGEKTHHWEEKKSHFCLREMHTGKFQRQFYVPKGVDNKGIKAKFENGLLSVTLQKTSHPKKKIQVN